jgi:hypothetical protein
MSTADSISGSGGKADVARTYRDVAHFNANAFEFVPRLLARNGYSAVLNVYPGAVCGFCHACGDSIAAITRTICRYQSPLIALITDQLPHRTALVYPCLQQVWHVCDQLVKAKWFRSCGSSHSVANGRKMPPRPRNGVICEVGRVSP